MMLRFKETIIYIKNKPRRKICYTFFTAVFCWPVIYHSKVNCNVHRIQTQTATKFTESSTINRNLTETFSSIQF